MKKLIAAEYTARRCCSGSARKLDFKTLLADPSGEAWRDGFTDEEVRYRLERCIYLFFMSALSVFDSFAFGLYFLGHAVQPGDFPQYQFAVMAIWVSPHGGDASRD